MNNRKKLLRTPWNSTAIHVINEGVPGRRISDIVRKLHAGSGRIYAYQMAPFLLHLVPFLWAGQHVVSKLVLLPAPTPSLPPAYHDLLRIDRN